MQADLKSVTCLLRALVTESVILHFVLKQQNVAEELSALGYVQFFTTTNDFA